MSGPQPHPPLRSLAERNALVVQYQDLVHHVVRKLYGHRLSPELYEDAVQIGVLGLIRAAELWDEARGVKFLTYAYWAVRQRVRRTLPTLGLIVTPYWTREEQRGRTREDIQEAVQRADHLRRLPVDFDSVVDHREPPPDPDRFDALYAALRGLSGRQQQVLRLRFTDGLTLHEVGTRLGVSKERARQIETAALERLRQRLGGTAHEGR